MIPRWKQLIGRDCLRRALKLPVYIEKLSLKKGVCAFVSGYGDLFDDNVIAMNHLAVMLLVLLL
ncbi:hypothetical protein T230_03995 [Tannerella sp. oral taxon BU063 isolate Cell 1/3]|uniref:Uncharacterized protein n=2 Tax=Tannerella serpentiformis TaxID=712710 RepID=W2CRH0_9BACT|nr:hypothetical protein N425_03350 [Tannerella sp. oral taxon BU063 isolate Cell 2]ETK09834.1 hypothetical protein T230_03995 [Tannerella sp. oral taxon BU063 isolate Cell 1/3]